MCTCSLVGQTEGVQREHKMLLPAISLIEDGRLFLIAGQALTIPQVPLGGQSNSASKKDGATQSMWLHWKIASE